MHFDIFKPQPLSKTLKDHINFEDVVSEKMKADETFKAMDTTYFDNLKFNINGVLSNKLGPKAFIKTSKLSQDYVINVVINRFEVNTEHYVNALEDNWISKEFMSVVFDKSMADIKPHEIAKAGEKGTVPRAKFVFTKSKEKESPDFDLESMFVELSDLIADDAGQADDGWDAMKNQITADNAERDDNLSNEKMY